MNETARIKALSSLLGQKKLRFQKFQTMFTARQGMLRVALTLVFSCLGLASAGLHPHLRSSTARRLAFCQSHGAGAVGASREMPVSSPALGPERDSVVVPLNGAPMLRKSFAAMAAHPAQVRFNDKLFLSCVQHYTSVASKAVFSTAKLCGSAHISITAFCPILNSRSANFGRCAYLLQHFSLLSVAVKFEAPILM